MDGFLIYGANGYTGSLITRTEINQGLRPILTARNAVAVDTAETGAVGGADGR